MLKCDLKGITCRNWANGQKIYVKINKKKKNNNNNNKLPIKSQTLCGASLGREMKVKFEQIVKVT